MNTYKDKERAGLSVEIEPDDFVGSYKMGELHGLTAYQITKNLGFPPNIKDDPKKVVNSWGFTVNGQRCAIWDWKGSHEHKRWHYYDPAGVMPLLFLEKHIEEN